MPHVHSSKSMNVDQAHHGRKSFDNMKNCLQFLSVSPFLSVMITCVQFDYLDA